MAFNSNDWVCTDPDSLQFRKKRGVKEYTFKEFRFDLLNINTAPTQEYVKAKLSLEAIQFADKYWDNEELWETQTIDVEEYTEESITEIMESYGYVYENGEIVDDSGNAYVDYALVAECIFEQETQY